MEFLEVLQIISNGVYLLVFIWLFGKFILSFFSNYFTQIQQGFLAPIVGIIACSMILSIVVTQFNTILFLPLFILVSFLLIFKKRINFSKGSFQLNKKDIMMMGLSLFTFLLILFIQLYRNSFYNSQLAPIGEVDFGIYINFSEQLLIHKNENTLNFLSLFAGETASSHSPYHYFDLWFNSFLQLFSTVNHIYVYIFLFIPILCTIGVNSLSFCLSVFIDSNTKYNWLFYLVISFIVSLMVGYFPFFNIGHSGYEITHGQMISYPKLIYSYLFLAFSSIFVKEKNIIGLTFVAIFCSSFFILFLPISIILIGILLLINVKKYSISDISVSFGVGISFITLLLIFYYYNGVFDSADIITNNDKEQSISILNRFKSYFIDYIPKLIYFIPLILTTFFVIIKKSGVKFLYEKFGFFIIYLFAGMISYVVTFENLESRQIVHQSFMPALQFMFVIAVYTFFIELSFSKYLKTALLLLLLIKFSVSMSYHINYKEDFYISSYFKKQIEKNENNFSKIGLLALGDEDIADNWRNVSPYLNFRTSFTKYIDNSFLIQASLININRHNHIPPTFKALYLNSPFIKFMSDKEYSLAVKEFIKKYEISYIVWHNFEAFKKLKVYPQKTIYDPHSHYYISFI